MTTPGDDDVAPATPVTTCPCYGGACMRSYRLEAAVDAVVRLDERLLLVVYCLS